jgi:outer membrane immunogenic protein
MRHSGLALLFAVASLSVGLGDAALAAKRSNPPPPPPPVWNWTGFYVGGNLGYSWGRDSGPMTLSDPVTGTLFSQSSNTALDGIIGGAQIGYNWQPANWVYGLETDIQGSAERGSANAICPGGTGTGVPSTTLNGLCTLGHVGDTTPFNVAAFPVTDSLSERLDWFGTVRARIGRPITPTVLPYVTGGLAYGRVSVTDGVSTTNITGPQGVNGNGFAPGAGAISNSTIKVGWTIGAGVECVLWGTWTGKIEYLYVDLGTVSGAFGTNIITPAGNSLIGSYSSHVTDNVLRVGLNYAFH